MKTNVGFNAATRVVDWDKRKNFQCFSCDKDMCNGFQILNDRKDYNDLNANRKIRIVSEEHFKRLTGFVEDFCYASCQGKHNVSQGPGFFEMVQELSQGIAYSLTHRKSHLELKWKAKLLHRGDKHAPN